MTALSFTGQKGAVSVGPSSSLPSKERGWCRRVVAISDCLQSLTSHHAKYEISCYLQKGFVEEALNPEEEVSRAVSFEWTACTSSCARVAKLSFSL